MRQRSTLAHELGHVLFEDWVDNDAGNWSDRTYEEIRADAFARHLLVPVNGLRKFLGSREPVTQSILSAVVQRFLVSPAVAAIALRQAGYIDAATKREWMGLSAPRLAVRFRVERPVPRVAGRLQSTQGTATAARPCGQGLRGGVLPAQAIATLRGIAVEAAEAELREAGVVPAERLVTWAEPTELPGVQVDLAALDEDLNAPDDRQDPTTQTET